MFSAMKFFMLDSAKGWVEQAPLQLFRGKSRAFLIILHSALGFRLPAQIERLMEPVLFGFRRFWILKTKIGKLRCMTEVSVQTKRIDDIPVLIKQQQEMGIAEVIDGIIPRYGNRDDLFR